MQPLLKKQTELLSRLDNNAKQDKLIQIAQLYSTNRIDDDGDRMENELKDVNKNIKSLNEKTGDGLNSNVIKLFKEMEKVGKVVTSRSMNSEEAAKITAQVGERRQFNTIKPRVENFKEGFKDFFTMRGFLDKTGIVSRGSGGLVSEYLDRGEARNKYAEDRLKVDDSNTNMEAGKLAKAAGTKYDSKNPEHKIFKDQAAAQLKETYKNQFNKQQDIQFDINKNEKVLKQYKENGYNEKQIERTPEFKERTKLATEMAKVDTRVRPDGFDTRTGEIKVKPENAAEQQAKASADVIPFPGGSSNLLSAASDEEAMIEQNRMVAEQTGLLIQIEENTRSLKGAGASQKPSEAAAAAGGFGLGDMLGGASRLGGIAKSAGRGLMSGAKTAGSFLMKRAGPVAALAAVGTGAYQAYQGYQSAGDKEKAALEDIDAKVDSGEITEEQAKGLRVESRENATVDKSAAVGGGAGTAVGGVAGALKGAALGAAVGSAVPIVGTVIGGAIGAGLGAVGGSFLGGKGGEYLGKKFGQAKNFFFGKSGESDRAKTDKTGSSVNIEFNETQFSQSDPENYAKFVKDRDELTKKYATEGAKRFNRKEPSQKDFTIAKSKAEPETIQKYRKEIEAAGAGKVTGGIKEKPVAPGDKTTEALKKTAEGVTPTAESTAMKQTEPSTAVTPETVSPKPVSTPVTGNMISKQSGDNEQAKLDSSKGGGNTSIVAAPTVNNNNTVQNTPVKLPPRNTDSTVNKYMQSRWAY